MEYYKEDIKSFLNYLKTQLKKSNVEVHLNTEATPEIIKKIKPDAVIVAVGSNPVTPNIPGVHRQNVINFYNAIEHEDKVGQNVVIIGGGTIGAEIGLEYASLKKKNVTIIELTDKIASQGNMLYKIALRQKMDQASTLNVMLKTTCQEIREDGVMVKTNDDEQKFIKSDTVIVAAGLRANEPAADNFYGIVPETFMIGDCVKPRKIMEAIFEGYIIASNL